MQLSGSTSAQGRKIRRQTAAAVTHRYANTPETGIMDEELVGPAAHQVDSDQDFEPQSRPRSCTWPLPRPDFTEGEDSGSPPAAKNGRDGAENGAGGGMSALDRRAGPGGADLGQQQPLRKAGKTSRRNAWGNLSYADLITKAIESSPDKRLTLSQIYDWMVRYVPYFKDKGDSNSSAGWKNSIRHNLSLHTRFIRVQNEGTGKSSWWMLNPEGGKTGKTPRRRSVSMDNNSKFLKSKGRASKKKAIAEAAQERGGDSPSSQHAKWSGSPTSHASDEYDVWADFRSRANSSASTLSGHLSPIMATNELDDLEDDDGAPSSPLMYPSPSSALSPSVNTRCSVEMPRLADLTGTISLNEGLPDSLLEDIPDNYNMSPSQHISSGALRQRSSTFSYNNKCPTLGASANTYCGTIYSQPAMAMMRRAPMQTIQENKQAMFPPINSYRNSALQDLLSSNSYSHKDTVITQADPMMSQVHTIVTSRNQRHGTIMGGGGELAITPFPGQSNLIKGNGLYHPPPAGHNAALNNSALSSSVSLMNVPQNTCSMASLTHHGHFQPYICQGTHMGIPDSGQGCYQGITNPPISSHDRFPADLDLEMFNGSLECDVESIILNEFMDNDEMDFNFDCALPPQNVGLTMAPLPSGPQATNQSWVPG
ncbi:forkhead box protein O3-like [Protopterus annectens]|uniref:forkhead box protein O3-like n=1 Tax=Protopterus annectens TaxID=7888 RepID=UPI001CFAE9B3|nr:forkhead box protein O3-like [Protopterus annectens]